MVRSDGAHIQIVGNHDAAITDFFAQQRGHHLARQRGWHGCIKRREHHVRGHQHGQASRRRGHKWRKLDAAQARPVVIDAR